MINGRTILVTGGTGSFGNKFIERVLERYSPRKIVVYSRDEMKQWEMQRRFGNNPRLRFFIGDVRDKERLLRACQDVDFLIHAAALKIVPSAEYNPFECVKTNIVGAMNVIDCAIDANVKRVVALSTDKACNPVNLYGATKLCSDKLFVAGNAYVGAGQDTRFSVVRYGNVMGSRGSVIPFFRSMSEQGELTITDERMTRFMITLDQAVDLVWEALSSAMGGEIYVKKIPSMKVVDIARAIAPHAKLRFVGVRPGEKLHEQMISREDARNALEFKDHYVILPQIEFTDDRYHCYRNARPCHDDFVYSSETNSSWMTQDELRKWTAQEYGSATTTGNEAIERAQVPQHVENMLRPIEMELLESHTVDGVGSQSLRSAVESIKNSDSDGALSILSQNQESFEGSPAGELLAAVAHYAKGDTERARQFVLDVLSESPENDAARILMNSIGSIGES